MPGEVIQSAIRASTEDDPHQQLAVTSPISIESEPSTRTASETDNEQGEQRIEELKEGTIDTPSEMLNWDPNPSDNVEHITSPIDLPSEALNWDPNQASHITDPIDPPCEALNWGRTRSAGSPDSSVAQKMPITDPSRDRDNWSQGLQSSGALTATPEHSGTVRCDQPSTSTQITATLSPQLPIAVPTREPTDWELNKAISSITGDRPDPTLTPIAAPTREQTDWEPIDPHQVALRNRSSTLREAEEVSIEVEAHGRSLEAQDPSQPKEIATRQKDPDNQPSESANSQEQRPKRTTKPPSRYSL